METVDVVVIDDDGSVRWLMQEVLSLAGYTYRAAASGPEGLELVAGYGPRLAIVDLKLGGMNGLEVARRIQALGSDTKILFVTGYDDAIEGKVADLPVVGIMEKPFNVAELLERVRLAVGNPVASSFQNTRMAVST